MKKLLAALTVLAALFVVSAASADPVRYGVADDWPKFHDCGDVWWKAQSDIGYQDLRLTVQWDTSTPTTIPYQSNIQAAIDCALLNNVRPILALYPLHPADIGSDPGKQAQFATFVSLVGQAFPTVQNFIVGNEPNQNRFWQPQFTGGQDAAGVDYEHTLAQSYDALKKVRPDSIVWGPAVSSRGNDNANTTVAPSHSPVWFIKDMGDAYRAQVSAGRTAPIFDEFNMHPYPPIQDTDPFSKPFQWPQAGAANLDRIKQALWDAFNGTPQKTPAEQPGGKTAQFTAAGLPMNMDEAGEQTTPGNHPGYTGTENISPIDEATQATRHVELAQIAACDPDVKSVLFFLIIDEGDLGGFQSGNMFVDQTHKASYDAMKSQIHSAQGNCTGTPAAWVHTTSVIGAQPIFGGPGTDPGSQPTDQPATVNLLTIAATANEDADYTASLVDSSGKTVASGTIHPGAGDQVQAYHNPPIEFHGPFEPGTYTYKLVLKAATNPARTSTFTSQPFSIGTGPAVGTSLALLISRNSAAFAAISPSFTQLFSLQRLTLSLSFPSLDAFLAQLSNFLAQARFDLTAALSLIGTHTTPRSTSSAYAAGKRVSVKVKKGQKIHFPKIKGLKAGTYKLQLTVKAGGKAGTLSTKPFTVDTHGHVKFAKVAKKKPVKKKKK